jgi:hypothetical protein
MNTARENSQYFQRLVVRRFLREYATPAALDELLAQLLREIEIEGGKDA